MVVERNKPVPAQSRELNLPIFTLFILFCTTMKKIPCPSIHSRLGQANILRTQFTYKMTSPGRYFIRILFTCFLSRNTAVSNFRIPNTYMSQRHSSSPSFLLQYSKHYLSTYFLVDHLLAKSVYNIPFFVFANFMKLQHS